MDFVFPVTWPWFWLCPQCTYSCLNIIFTCQNRTWFGFFMVGCGPNRHIKKEVSPWNLSESQILQNRACPGHLFHRFTSIKFYPDHCNVISDGKYLGICPKNRVIVAFGNCNWLTDLRFQTDFRLFFFPFCSERKTFTTIGKTWRNQMETFFALLALCARISPVTGEFPSQRPVARSLIFLWSALE